jgi:hypothetical protein
MTAPDLAAWPSPPATADVRNATQLVILLAELGELTIEAFRRYHDAWRQVAGGREPQVLSALGGLLKHILQFTGGCLPPPVPDNADLPPQVIQAANRILGYVHPLLAGFTGIMELPEPDRFEIGSVLARLILQQHPDMPAALRGCLNDPGWPHIDSAAAAAQWYGLGLS